MPKELVEAVFLGSLEVVAFKHQTGCRGFVDLFALELPAAHDIGVVPEQVPAVHGLVAHDGEGLRPQAILAG